MQLPLTSLFVALSLVASCHGGVVVIGDLARATSVEPGESFSGTILLKNTDDRPVGVSVFQTDYLFYADGTNNYSEPGSMRRSNASWITITPTRLQIGPGETVPVRYQGDVPAEPEEDGTYWSMIMVEPGIVPAITPDGKADQVAVGLQTNIRFGIQIVTEVGQTGAASLQVLDKRLVAGEAGPVLEIDIGNDGERLLVPAMTLELFDGNGASVGFFEAGASRIYPTCSVRKRVNLSRLPAGKYAAMVLLDSGDLQVMGARYDLELSP